MSDDVDVNHWIKENNSDERKISVCDCVNL